MSEDSSRPLIVTARMDLAVQSFFDQLRARHFPPDINYLSAHITLFHKLPGQELPKIRTDLEKYKDRFPIGADATGPYPIGRGVAVEIQSVELIKLRAELAALWGAWLSPQDRNQFRPHVTVQNKVSPDKAGLLLAAMTAEFVQFPFAIVGIDLWHYDGGPWQAIS